MLKLPYGLADFYVIRRDGLVYVDRTAHIRDVEELGRVLVFLRPRRFGKSLWLQTLANYYDVRRADEFDQLFGDLHVGKDPTPLRNRYFVLQWNFSSVNPQGSADDIARSLSTHVNSQAQAFLSDYEGHVDARVDRDDPPDAVLARLLSAVRKTPYKLYILIDEYDNFVNEVMARDVETYRALLHNDGPFKVLFKRIKAATEGEGLERVFVTGVAPVALSDLTSGFNISENVTHKPELAALCGFRAAEIREILKQVVDERGMPPETVESTLEMMRTWYNGYRFTREHDELLYNPTNALYFLKNLLFYGTPPEKLHDANLRTDYAKLLFLARTATGTGVIEHLAEGENDEIAADLVESFSVNDMTKGLEKDRDVIASMLYYMGLLTRTDVPFRLRIPNLVVRKLFLDRLLEIFLPDLSDSSGARQIALQLFQDGDVTPLLYFFENKLLPVLSNRDRGAAPKDGRPASSGSGVNETAIKVLFLSILFADNYYRISSEPELEKEYSDLCLLRRPEARGYGLYDLLFEFKLVRKKELGKKGRELREMDDAELRKLPQVKQAFDEARQQAERYRTVLAKQEDELRLRTWLVVAVGLERMLGEEVPVSP